MKEGERRGAERDGGREEERGEKRRWEKKGKRDEEGSKRGRTRVQRSDGFTASRWCIGH